MILIVGATGELGGRVARLLRERDAPVRALVRSRDRAAELESAGIELVEGDLRAPAAFPAALSGVDTVVCTATAISRALAGEKGASIAEIDDRGIGSLVAAADDAGVSRFVYVSYAGLGRAPGSPLDRAKRANESRLGRARLREVIARPAAFQEVWLSEQAQIDWRNGKMSIFGRGEAKTAYVSVQDVARMLVELALDDDPPRLVEFGGPEKLSRKEVAVLFERESGRPIKRRHMPRPLLRPAMIVLGPVRPAVASLIGLGLMLDSADADWDDAPLRERGIEPRPASAWIRELVRGG